MPIITVPGRPQSQGSLSSNGRGGLYHSNKNLKPWRTAIANAIRNELPDTTYDGPVAVKIEFSFAHLKAHFRTAGELKDSAPLYKTTAPDLDKLARGVGDALTESGVIHDDAQISELRCRKIFGSEDQTIIVITPLEVQG